jgi:brefeldin A-inhibited guanine nucleotide-exchange protein
MVEELANRKNALLKAIRIFNVKPRKGFSLLSELGLFDPKDYNSVAIFLRSSQELSKTALGDFLGDGDESNVQIMYAFLDTFDFKNVAFVKAIRLLLQSFRLPGEAQKIDRIMEKFADRFVETNPTVFVKADTAYTLAFSVMMLNTDLHSPSIKHRMQVEDFIKMNRGINDENDLPEEFLTNIFNEVKREEIILEEEHSGKVAQVTMNLRLNDVNDIEKKELYRKEVLIMEKKSHRLIASVDSLKKAVPFRSVRQPEIARLMFSMICWPMMATLGCLFESSPDVSLSTEDSFRWLESVGHEKTNLQKPILDLESDPNFVHRCLHGFVGTIYLASVFKLDTERDALISSVANLTSLSNFAGMKNKNVCAVGIILSLPKTLGEYLDNSWIQILKVISQLEKVQAIRDPSNDNQKNSAVDSADKSNTVIDLLATELNKQTR